MEKSLKTVVARLPNYADDINSIRTTLIAKFKNETITAVTDFRQLSKIATAIDNLGVAQRSARRTLDRVFDANSSVGIREAYEETVGFGYVERQAGQHVEFLAAFLDEVTQSDRKGEIDEAPLKQLNDLYRVLKRFLGK